MVTAQYERDDQRLYRLLKALGNPVRLQIVRFIQNHPRCIGNQIQLHLPDHVSRAQSTLSQHLKILRAAGIIQARDDGSATCYSINQEIFAWLREQLEDM
ncbi:MAG: winged helix-turn-helix transcriptional regulator [Chloroflexi bacterium SZAS-1]|jgi:DNA-binding transcriptional ArsR family regulator|nr:winged helix-turn-helix transcriptional regulator [Chloroflexi bacterium SZAS-1]HNP85432.1 metalloregulator ArsR/SmtB family transcription factor [Kouleothrix sp.]